MATIQETSSPAPQSDVLRSSPAIPSSDADRAVAGATASAKVVISPKFPPASNSTLLAGDPRPVPVDVRQHQFLVRATELLAPRPAAAVRGTIAYALGAAVVWTALAPLIVVAWVLEWRERGRQCPANLHAGRRSATYTSRTHADAEAWLYEMHDFDRF
ncbi:MAG: hypothetical protein KDA61_18545 [Planctomycetales bacterium]|nr:hypothetical protein [Planctomycetales bacterium]